MSLQRTLLNKNFLRISSLLIGSILWSVMGNMHYSTITITVPVCLYNQTETLEKLSFPESITVTLKGKKSDLRAINFTQLAVHIDATKITLQTNGLPITNKNLFLPDQVKLVNYKPMNFTIEKMQ